MSETKPECMRKHIFHICPIKFYPFNYCVCFNNQKCIFFKTALRLITNVPLANYRISIYQKHLSNAVHWIGSARGVTSKEKISFNATKFMSALQRISQRVIDGGGVSEAR
jgi:hypothetical protein